MGSMLDLLDVSTCISCISRPGSDIPRHPCPSMACAWSPQELSGRDADVNVVSNEQMQLTMAAAGPVDIHRAISMKTHVERS